MTGINKAMEKRLGVPVIDGVAASLAYMESLLRCQLRTSKKRCYATPQHKPLDGLEGLENWYSK